MKEGNYMKKKILAFMLISVMLCGILTSCGEKENSSETTTATTSATNESEQVDLIVFAAASTTEMPT